jgi:trans-2,3-dihydro-3-hydroxyanthranilate isomerase
MKMADDLSFMTLDVFSDRAFGGNPLAVFPRAEHLDSAQMQLIALEMNYSETTFILPPKDPAHTAQVRIFTPTTELPFAGHPSVGTAWALALNPHWIPGVRDTRHMMFEQIAGVVDVDVQYDNAGDLTACWISTPQSYRRRHLIPQSALAECVGLSNDRIRGDGVVATVGVPFAFAEVVSRAALAQCKPSLPAFEYCDRNYGYPEEGFALMVYFCETQELVHGRMFAPLIGIQEDPATGSAAGALAGLLAADTSTDLVMHQGQDMGRPSTLHLRTEHLPHDDLRIQVGGCCVPMIDGVMRSRF